MEKIKKEGLRSEQGFTMIELIIVIAILGILAAILVPSFTTMTRKSRLKADISTARQVQTQIDLYVADHDGAYPGNAGAEPTTATLPAAIEELVIEEYMKASDTDGAGVVTYQTQGVISEYTAATTDHLTLNIDGADPNVKILGGKLTAKEREWMINFTPAAPETP